MSQLPCAIIITDAVKAGAEAVLSAYRGAPMQFGRPLIPVDTVSPDHTTPPTHWMMFDASTSQEDVVVYLGFAQGDLPPLANAAEGAAWGVGDIPSGQAALGYVSGEVMQVYAVSGDVVPSEFVEGVPDGNGGRAGGLLASRGLMYRPEMSA
jgi:hypothetical protein